MRQLASQLILTEDAASRVYLVVQPEQQQLPQAAAEYMLLKSAADTPSAGECLAEQLQLLHEQKGTADSLSICQLSEVKP